MATIKDVAAYAGVSTGTVSNYLTGSHPVALKKQKAIIEAMIALKYESNASARILRSKRSNTVGLVVPNISDPYYQRVLEGVESYVTADSYLLTLSITENDPAVETKVIQEMLNNQVAGIIIVTCQPEYTAFFKTRLLQHRIPAVFLDRKVTGLAATFLGCDTRREAFELTERLLQAGKRAVAFVSSSLRYSDQADAMDGYREALERAGLPVEDALISNVADGKAVAFAEMLRILSQQQPDGVVTTSELVARGVREAIRTFSAEAVGQIPVCTLGVNTWDSANSGDVEMTVQRRAIALGTEACNLLFRQINDPSTAEITSRIIPDGRPLEAVCSTLEYGAAAQSLRIMLVPMAPSRALLQMIPAYERQTGTHIEVQIMNHAGYFHALNQSLYDGTAADVVLVDMPWLPIFAAQHVLTDVTPYIQRRKLDISIYVSGCIKNLCEYQDRIYGLPLAYTPQMLFYRRDLFNDPRIRNTYEQKNGRKLRAPKTWSEFNTVAEFFTRSRNLSSPTKYGVSLACKYPECMSAEIRTRMRSFGGRIVDENQHVVFESQENLNAFSQLIDTLRFCPLDYRTKEREDIVTDFITGGAAMIINFHPILNEVLRANVRHYLGVAQVPGFQPTLGGWCMCVPSCSDRQEAAMRFIEWAGSETVSSKLMVLNSQSVVSDVLDNDELQHRNRWFRSWRKSYQTATPFHPFVLKNNAIIPIGDLDWILFQVVKKVTDEGMPLADALHWGQNEFTTLIFAYEMGRKEWRRPE